MNRGNGKLSGHDDPGKRIRGTLKSALNEIEGVLIAATEPAFNKQGARFRGIGHYRQVKHDAAEDVTPKQLKDLVLEVQADLLAKIDRFSQR